MNRSLEVVPPNATELEARLPASNPDITAAFWIALILAALVYGLVRIFGKKHEQASAAAEGTVTAVGCTLFWIIPAVIVIALVARSCAA